MERRKRSKAWLHFTKRDENSAVCNQCSAVISCKGSNTSNMLKHLSVKHGIKLQECHVFDHLQKGAPAANVAGQTSSTVTSVDDDDNDDDGHRQAAATGSSQAASPSTSTHSQVTPFTLAAQGARWNEERVEECHRAVTKFVVKGLHPFSTVEQPYFREMTRALQPKYNPPSRDVLTNQLIPAWYQVERENLISELRDARKAAITADGWTSLAQDHYVTVTVHYTKQSEILGKVLRTKAVYEAQTGAVVAEEIEEILEEFGINEKVVAATVDNAANMDVAVKKLQFVKIGCFAHTLNLAAQKVHQCNAVTNWAARIRSVVKWMRKSSMAKTVLTEKQRLLNLPKHALILDVKTRWNSLYLMMERFLEQFPAIQAAAMDPRIKRQAEKEKLLEKMHSDDFKKAEEFVQLMRLLYTSTLCVSSEKSPTSGQILPILKKLEHHCEIKPTDSPFSRTIKEKVWADLSSRYQDEEIQTFLEEATVMDPRFKHKMENDDAIWDRLKTSAVTDTLTRAEEVPVPQETQKPYENVEEEEEEEEEEEDYTPPVKRPRTALEELFGEEEQDLQQGTPQEAQNISERLDLEVQMYRSLPAVPMASDPVLWWWQKRDTLPLLYDLAQKYLCAQASSTPSERVFSTAGDTISAERSRILPEKADMLVFLHRNC